MLTIINVKETLADSLIKLTKTKPISKITVQDIVTECNTSRRTFYNHFQDKYELINWIYESKSNEILSCFTDSKSWYECLIDIYNYFYSNKTYFMNISSFSGQNSFIDAFYVHTRDYLFHHVEKNYGQEYLTEDLIYSIDYNSYGQVYMCIKWISNGMPVPPEKMAQHNVNNIPPQLKKFLIE